MLRYMLGYMIGICLTQIKNLKQGADITSPPASVKVGHGLLFSNSNKTGPLLRGLAPEVSQVPAPVTKF